MLEKSPLYSFQNPTLREYKSAGLVSQHHARGNHSRQVFALLLLYLWPKFVYFCCFSSRKALARSFLAKRKGMIEFQKRSKKISFFLPKHFLKMSNFEECSVSFWMSARARHLSPFQIILCRLKYDNVCLLTTDLYVARNWRVAFSLLLNLILPALLSRDHGVHPITASSTFILCSRISILFNLTLQNNKYR